MSNFLVLTQITNELILLQYNLPRNVFLEKKKHLVHACSPQLWSITWHKIRSHYDCNALVANKNVTRRQHHKALQQFQYERPQPNRQFHVMWFSFFWFFLLRRFNIFFFKYSYFPCVFTLSTHIWPFVLKISSYFLTYVGISQNLN